MGIHRLLALLSFLLLSLAAPASAPAAALAAPAEPAAPAAAPAGEDLFMWTARDGGTVIHLLGSVHVASEDFYPLDAAIEAAFAESEAIAAELDLSDPAVVSESSLGLMQKGMLPEGQSLQQLLPDSTWQQLEAHLAARGLPAVAFARMRPALAAMVLAVQEMERLGYSATAGLDLHLLERAKPDKRIIALETVAEQMEALLPPGEETGTLLLVEFLAQVDELPEIFTDMVEAWRHGDVAAMETLVREQMLDDPRLDAYHDRLLTQRNLRMGDRLLAAVSPGDTVLAVVGAAHLIGETGLPALLAERGFAVEQVPAAGRPEAGEQGGEQADDESGEEPEQ